MRAFARRSILLALLVVTMSWSIGRNVTVANPEPPLTSFKPQLWAPDQPVDILVYNPNNEPLQLPEPYTARSIPEHYGPAVTEDNLTALSPELSYLAPTVVTVGQNVTFPITYGDGTNEGFNDPTLGTDRRTAFEFAVSLWADRLQGPATISITATMTALSGTMASATLATGAPGNYWENFANRPVTDTFYPESLVEITSGSDPSSGIFDISVDFNSDVDDSFVLGNRDWYYGTDAMPGNDFDFVTVSLHELAHGLGFLASFRADGTFGITNTHGIAHPVIYDRFLVDGSGTRLMTLTPSPNNVTGGDVFWDGLRGRFAFNNDFPGGSGDVPIHAPPAFESGSSIHHLEEATFAGIWELMTPGNSGPVHDPDSIVMGILQDIGYSLPNSRYVDVNGSGFEDGSSANPFNMVEEGVNDVPTDGFVRILPGSYPEKLTIDRAMELHSSGGTAIIGVGVGSP